MEARQEPREGTDQVQGKLKFILPLVVLNSTEHFPVTVGLANWYASAVSGSGGALLFTVVMAGALVSILPVILAFLIMQRFWQGGLGAGGVKA